MDYSNAIAVEIYVVNATRVDNPHGQRKFFMGDLNPFLIEFIGWVSTAVFLFSIIVPKRSQLHGLGIFAAVTTGIYAFAHGATAIWVKWLIAFFFHSYMLWKSHTAEPKLR